MTRMRLGPGAWQTADDRVRLTEHAGTWEAQVYHRGRWWSADVGRDLARAKRTATEMAKRLARGARGRGGGG